jgi:predicted dehydrogenase
MQLRIGIVGVGGLGYLQAKTFSAIDGVSLVAAVDVSAEARGLFEEEFGLPAYEHYREFLAEHGAELAAVSIVTPHTLHYEQAMACLRRDLHVLVEKPMVTDVRQAVELVETADERDLVLQVGYQRHFDPAFRELRRVLSSGRIGDVHAVNCHLGQDWVELHGDTWRADPELSGGGQLYDTGSHLLDALLWTTGAEPERVSADIEYAEPRVDVNSALTIRLLRDGEPITAGVTISGDGVDVSPTEGYFYWGTEGRASYVDDRITVSEKGAVTYRTELTGESGFQTLTREKLANFADSIGGTAEPAVPGEVGLRVTALTEAIYRADETGTRTSVQSVIDEAVAARQ